MSKVDKKFDRRHITYRECIFVKARHNGYLRAEFLNALNNFIDCNLTVFTHHNFPSEKEKLRQVIGIMWNCTDYLPNNEARLILVIRGGSDYLAPDFPSVTYARAARVMSRHLRELERPTKRQERASTVPSIDFSSITNKDLDDIFDLLDFF